MKRPKFSFEGINIFREHPLLNRHQKVRSTVVEDGNNLILGTLVEYPEGTRMMDVHYMKKYTADNKHATG